MLIRIRSRDGNFRFELQPTDDIAVLIGKILETSPEIDPQTLALSNQPRGGENLVSTISGNLVTLGISHGDLLFASYTPLNFVIAPIDAPTASTLSGKVVVSDPNDLQAFTTPTASTTTSKGAKKPWELAVEEPVDTYWEERDGKIERAKGMGGCVCGSKSMCDYCMPLEPFDPNYQNENKIKHLSFHSYLRKTHANAPLSSQSTSYIPPLSNPSYAVQVPCSSGSHPSWPAGICTKCQPSAVTLSRQTYRMVDHVEFARAEIIETLLSFWRRTGSQRFGYLLGRYEPYEVVPMGIKAVVEAIHEPPQEPLADGVTVGFPWEDEQRVERLAAACGLKVVGVIYTDLTADRSTEEATQTGKVLYKRHINSFFLSSLEILFSANLQRSHPAPSRFSSSGTFSSKFLTCVLSGDSEGGIAVAAYQVSDQAMGMDKEGMLEASVDPGVMRVKEEGEGRYVPDVFYRYKNKYGIEVKESAKPCFPVEYLLVNVSHGFPSTPNPLFLSPTPFNVENRSGVEEQAMGTVVTRVNDLAQGRGGITVASWLSDWHLFVWLEGTGLFTPDEMSLIGKIITTRDEGLVAQLVGSSSWATLARIASESTSEATPATMTHDPAEVLGAEQTERPCPHCTFVNEGSGPDCGVCGLPLLEG